MHVPFFAQDIIDKKDIKEAIKDETSFLQRKYPTLATRQITIFITNGFAS